MTSGESSEPDEIDSGRPVEFVQSLERGLAVIRAFSAERPSLSLSDVAKHTGLTRAAARRFLLTLQHLGYVASDGRDFSLRPAVLRLGYAYLSSFSLSGTADDHLRRIADDLHESCSASVLDGDEIVYISRASTTRIMAINLAVGTRLSAVHTSMGRVLLAAAQPAELERALGAADLTARTPFSLTDAGELRAAIELTREQRWASIDQELEIGVRSIAVPIRDSRGTVIASINASAHASRVTMQTLETEFLVRLRTTAREIEIDLESHRGIERY